MANVQCYCKDCKTDDTIQEMGSTNYGRFNHIYDMFKRLNWMYGVKDSNLGSYVRYVYGEDNNKLFTIVWNRSKVLVTTELGSNRVDYSVFNNLVKAKSAEMMKKLNELRNEYEDLREDYNEAKYYNSTYDTVEVSEPGLNTTTLQCKCGNDDIFVVSPHTHSKHLGVTKDEIAAEFEYVAEGNGIYSDDNYDYSNDTVLNTETHREYSDHIVFNQTVEAHKAEALFYSIASTMSIGQACKKLGKKAYLISDVISDYYTVKGIK